METQQLGVEQSTPTFTVFDFDKPETWADRQIYSYPDFDVTGFQVRLNDIFGLSETNLPIVRLVWPGDIKKCYSKFYVSWNGLWGNKSELRAKYLYASIKIPGTPDIIDIPPARWILEQYNHPGQYMASWEATRFDKKTGRELRPAPPPNGYYSHLWTIARHDEQCCKAASENMKVCWGSYRLPDDHDLEMLKSAKQARDRDRKIDPTKPLDEKTLEQIKRETEERIAKTDAIVEQHLKEFIDENALEMIEFFTGVKVSDTARRVFSIPTELKGKYKINTEKKAEIIPYTK